MRQEVVIANPARSEENNIKRTGRNKLMENKEELFFSDGMESIMRGMVGLNNDPPVRPMPVNVLCSFVDMFTLRILRGKILS